MPTRVSASVSVNPLSDFKNVPSSVLDYVQQSAILGGGYTDYRKQDYNNGASKEITKSYSTGRQLKVNMRLRILADVPSNPSSLITGETVVGTVSTYRDLQFMPLAEVKSDLHPHGVEALTPNNPTKVKATRLLKSMNLALSTVSAAILNTGDIPPLGSTNWGKYAKPYIRDPSIASSEGAYRTQLLKDKRDKEEQLKDVTDVSIGYFGTFNKDTRVSPKALYETYLEILPKTKQYTTDVGTARKFELYSRLYRATYTMNGYIHRTVNGTIEGNKKRSVGYSKVDVYLEEDTPLSLEAGTAIHSDYSDDNPPYFDRTTWDGEAVPNYLGMRKVYVTIKVQDTPHSYKELVLVDLYQETVIEGSGVTRIGNSGHQNDAEGEMTWTEAYIAESFIPLTKTAMLKVKLFDKRRLLAETKCHFIQAINKQDIKWYQTTLFAAILRIVGVVVTIFTSGADGGLTGEVLVQLIINTVIAYGINYAVKLLIEKGIISAEFGALLIVASNLYVANNGSIANIDLSLADTVTMLVEATGNTYRLQMLEESKEYKDKIRKLEEESKKYEDTPEEYSSSLNTSLGMELRQMVDDSSMPIESVNNFFGRTLDRFPQPIYIDLNITEELNKGLEL